MFVCMYATGWGKNFIASALEGGVPYWYHLNGLSWFYRVAHLLRITFNLDIDGHPCGGHFSTQTSSFPS